jgi:riboflavin biosynthesis pyrimidine reductase/predicted DsbA family dithiol-disulfide isomerase
MKAEQRPIKLVGQNLAMPLTIPIAHDFLCPWCWGALFQVKTLKARYDVEFSWLSYELMPEELEWGTPGPVPEVNPDKPVTPSRFELFRIADGFEVPAVERPKRMRSHNAHELVEYAKEVGADVDGVVEALYRALWEEGRRINDLQVLQDIAQTFDLNGSEVENVVLEQRFRDRIVGFDDPAYKSGVYNVATFFIDGRRYAEQPLVVLESAVAMVAEKRLFYGDLTFPSAPDNRPYVLINMVASIDGKILSGSVEDGSAELGSRNDREAMRRIEGHADGVLLGATTLRHTVSSWSPKVAIRIAISGSGKVNLEHSFLQGEGAFVATNATSLPPEKTWHFDGEHVDLHSLLEKAKLAGVNRLLVLGGSELNSQLLTLGFVDEIFLTVAPKVKLGRDIPTMAGGSPLPFDALLNYELIEQHQVASELFLRYRRRVDRSGDTAVASRSKLKLPPRDEVILLKPNGERDEVAEAADRAEAEELGKRTQAIYDSRTTSVHPQS